MTQEVSWRYSQKEKEIVAAFCIRCQMAKLDTFTSDTFRRLAKDLRELGGPSAIAKKCIESIKNLDDEIIIIDGVRSFYEVDEFRKEWKFPLIAIELSDQERFKRLYERDRSDDSKSIEEIKQRDKREIGFGLKEVINKSDHKIQNNSTIEELIKKTRKLVVEILQNY